MATAQKSTPTPEPSGFTAPNIGTPNIGTPNASMPAAEGVSVDKIRDLLFGNQMQDYDRRFSTLEERLLKKLNELESETSRRLSALESTFKKQIESMGNQFREEKDRTSDSEKELQRSMRDAVQGLEKRLGALSDQQSRLERDFVEQAGQQAEALREEIKRRSEDMRATIDRMFAELSNVKTDRNLLAGLFVEIAKCLNQDFVPKGAGGNGGPR